MTNSTTVGTLQTALAFPFKGDKWLSRFLVAGLITLFNFIIPFIPALLILGYNARIMRRIATGDGVPVLPDWNDWGDLLIDGLRLFAVNAIYYIPGLLLMVFGYLAMIIPALSGAFDQAEQGWAPFWTFIIMWMFIGFGILYIVAVQFALSAIQVHVIAKRRFGAAFEFGAWWKILRANMWGFVLAVIIVFGVKELLSVVFAVTWFTICLICLTPFVILAIFLYLEFVSSALFALAYRDAQAKLTPVAES